ncbi:MAG: helix-turn-helix transcriptional regulator [Leptolyngbyaceae cyanobacterium MO_188.B28]|nr:helix-turn-helix transcriptional regulator [Leptolyngbyaceae cyanobacterium MO_188.B28]
MIKNKVKEIIDNQHDGVVYQFHRRTGLAKATCYRLYDNPEIMPKKEVVQKICAAYNLSLNDVIEEVAV